MKYSYAAKTRDGLSVKRGEIDAPSKDAALKSIRDRNLVVYSLVEQGGNFNIKKYFPFLNKISLNDKLRFTEQLANMTTAGLPLTKALELLITQSKNKSMSEMVQTTLNEVESGTPLHKSLEQRGDVFDNSYVNLVKAGESSGKLDQVLLRLTDTLQKERAFRAKVQGALLYPAIITIVMIVVFALIIVFLVPKMTTIYVSFDVELPLTTQLLIKTSDFIIHFWWIVLIIIAGIIAAYEAFKATPAGERYVDQIFLKIPLFGSIIRQSNVVEYTRSLGLLSEAGVPLVEALEIVRNGLQNTLFRESVDKSIEDVKKGYPLSESMSISNIFPQFVGQMLAVGEETGTVDQRLNALAKYYEDEVDKVVKNLSTAIEPLIMIMLGILVFVLIISVIMPIYQLTSQFG